MSGKKFRILSLDGGGAKGFYTLGVLRQLEGMIGMPLYRGFDLIFGTSTGSIIAALLSLGHAVEEIHELYKEHVVTIMKTRGRDAKSEALERLANTVFGEQRFDAVKTNVGVVTTKWVIERPMIFKGSIAQAHGRMGTFVPGFGCTISDAVQASCSAYPFFRRKIVTTSAGDRVELIDGGYCANNPTLYSIADATVAMKIAHEQVRVVSVGVGEYPPNKLSAFHPMWWINKVPEVQLLQKTFDINTQSMEQLRAILFKDIATVRISESYPHPDMATDLFEHDLEKLNILRQRGGESFAPREAELKEFFA